MQRHKVIGNGNRSFQPGKGGADRSPGWRGQYDSIAWPHDDTGFVQIKGKQIKRYGIVEPKPENQAPRIIIH